MRYVDENGDICEDLLKCIHCQSGSTGKDLYNEIISSLENFNLDIQNCCGQDNDGDGAVAGKVNGFADLFLKENPKALYTHCASHRLTLAICSSCDIVSVTNLISAVKDVTYFLNYHQLEQIIWKILFSPKRRLKKSKQNYLIQVVHGGWPELMVWTYLKMSLFQL